MREARVRELHSQIARYCRHFYTGSGQGQVDAQRISEVFDGLWKIMKEVRLKKKLYNSSKKEYWLLLYIALPKILRNRKHDGSIDYQYLQVKKDEYQSRITHEISQLLSSMDQQGQRTDGELTRKSVSIKKRLTGAK